MYSSMWLMSIVALLMMDIRTGALQQGNEEIVFRSSTVFDIQAHRCHQCFPTNTTSCQQAGAGGLTATCPSSRPYCATVALAPDFASSLGCAAPAAAEPCSLTNSPRQTLELTCICVGHLCNAPFSIKIQNELLNFSSPSTNDTEITEAFFKLSNFANVSESALYKAITVTSDGNSTVSTLTPEADGSLMPRAEALKQQTAPSEDDEDENEGSGAYEDSRLHIQSQSASAPAAPSSYLPADENNANTFATIPFLPLAFIYIMI